MDRPVPRAGVGIGHNRAQPVGRRGSVYAIVFDLDTNSL